MKKLNFVQQISNNDCGQACVSMILKEKVDSKLTLGQIGYIIHSNKNGTKYLDIKKGLEKLGIYTEICECEKNNQVFNEINYPVITQTLCSGENHYIVLYGVKNKKIIVADPLSKGIKKISMDSFIEKWIPYIIEVKKISLTEFYNRINNVSDSRFNMFKIFKSHLMLLILSWILSIIVYFLSIVMTGMYSAFIDTIIPNKYVGIISTILFGYTHLLVLSFLIGFLNSIISVKLNNDVDKSLTKKLLNSYLEKNNEEVDLYNSGEIVTRFRNIPQIRIFYIYLMQMLPIDCIGIISILYLLFRQNNQLLLLMVIPATLFILLIYLSHDRLKKYSEDLFDKEETYNSSLIESIENINTIQKYFNKDKYLKKVELLINDFYKSMRKIVIYNSLVENIKNMILALFNLYILGLGSYMVINDNMAAGSLLVFNALCLKVFNPFQQITNMQSAYEQSKISKLKYEDIINTKLKKTFGKEEFLTVNELELSNVSFEYEVNRKILNNAYLKIRKNTNFALMGKSGAGKTTIGKLISNYYRLDDGNIKINGKDISTYTEKIIKEKILYVSQDVDLFNYSIMENILLGRDIKEEKVFAISEELGFDEFVKKLPNG